MPNVILPVEALQKQIRAGYPDGVEPVVRQIPVLFARITELENALVKFAHVALRAEQNDGLPMVQVYLSDCREAYNVLARELSVPAAPPGVEYMPAE